jgi:hypothetical protein
VTKFDQTFDYAFSRRGTMFFANPVAALRNVREALVPRRLLNMVVWRRKLDNEFMHCAETVVEQYSRRRRTPRSRAAVPARSRWRTRTPSATF